MHRRFAAAAAVLFLVAAACNPSAPAPAQRAPTTASPEMVAEVASYELLADGPNRFLVGLVTEGQLFVSYGTVELNFSYLGTKEDPVPPQPGPRSVGRFLPVEVEGTDGSDGGAEAEREGPVALQPSEARGVYAAYRVLFDRPGFWQVQVEADLRNGGGRRTATAAFEVLDAPMIPAPGQKAPATDNPTMDAKGVPPGAIDSRAETTGGRIPDPELHRWTVAGAMAKRRPAVVVFSTPVYCLSRFCGPVTDVVQKLAKRFGDRAAFIHVEIWRNFEKQVLNPAAAAWLFRDGNLNEPWLFLVGSDGVIRHRWDNVFTQEEVSAELRKLPPTT